MAGQHTRRGKAQHAAPSPAEAPGPVARVRAWSRPLGPAGATGWLRRAVGPLAGAGCQTRDRGPVRWRHPGATGQAPACPGCGSSHTPPGRSAATPLLAAEQPHVRGRRRVTTRGTCSDGARRDTQRLDLARLPVLKCQTPPGIGKDVARPGSDEVRCGYVALVARAPVVFDREKPIGLLSCRALRLVVGVSPRAPAMRVARVTLIPSKGTIMSLAIA